MSDFSDILKSLQKKISGDPIVSGLISRFDNQPAVFANVVPKGALIPYILIFLVANAPFDTHTSYGERVLVQISVFARGGYEAYNILSAIDEALHWKKAEPVNYNCLGMRRVAGPRYFFEEKEEVSHVLSDYEILCQEV